MANPNASFLFPYRWLTDAEDKKFLAENIRRQIKKSVGGDEDNTELREAVLAYKVIIQYVYKKPLKIPFTKKHCQDALKDFFPNAQCISVSEEYVQSRSKTALPVLDFNLYILK